MYNKGRLHDISHKGWLHVHDQQRLIADTHSIKVTYIYRSYACSKYLTKIDCRKLLPLVCCSIFVSLLWFMTFSIPIRFKFITQSIKHIWNLADYSNRKVIFGKQPDYNQTRGNMGHMLSSMLPSWTYVSAC